MRSYRDLEAWKLGISLTKRIYQITGGFPDSERYGLISQLRRASVSIPSNIAEGWGRGSTTEYARFLRVARGSMYEVETQLIIAKELAYLQDEELRRTMDETSQCGRVLSGLLKSIEAKLGRGTQP
ncbi:MAG: four helix bundle protein [Phycisphaeraceae bacterium]|nr:MAG: four helix bundle protein [Phycisphaeraceae bacterium]